VTNNNRRLDNYVSVAQRIHDASPEIVRIETTAPVMMTEKMGYIRATIWLRNEKYATATATFMLGLPGAGARATNPIEDCETSAIGRCLAFLGWTADKTMGYSVASREEVEEAMRREIAMEKFQDVVAESTRPQITRTEPTRPQATRENLNERMVARIVALAKQAEELALDLNHPLLSMFYDNINDLSEPELVQLGKYIAEEIKKNG
jgi:hypothetical protein